jgi:signal transduction histidine kinase
MVLQAESGVFATEQLGSDDRSAALASIGALGRAALHDLRSLLDALDPVDESGSARVPASVHRLVERIRTTGYPVSLHVADGVHLGPVTTAVVHDVCREAVTNAMKHAPGAPVHVQLTALGDAWIELRIENPVPVASASRRLPPPGGSGRGQRIMEGRVAAAGGSLQIDAGPTYRTTVRLPADAREREDTGDDH